MAEATYLRRIGLAFLAVVAALALHGLVVDPFGIWGTRLLPVEGRVRSQGDRLVKGLELTRRPITTLIVGNSRMQYALDPVAVGPGTYNGALGAAHFEENAATIRAALAAHPGLKRVIWGLDPIAFDDPLTQEGDFAESPLAGRSPWRARFLLTFTQHALEGGGKFWENLVTRQGQPMRADGLHRAEKKLTAGDRFGVFASVATTQVRACYDARAATATIARRAGPMRELLVELSRRGVAVDLVFPPSHAWGLELQRLAGREVSQTALRRMVVEAAGAAGGPGAVRVVDLDRLDPEAREPVPTAPGGGETRFFWDPAHFKPEVGTAMLARLADPVLALTPDRIVAAQAARDAALAAWRAERPAEARWLADLWKRLGCPSR